MGSKAKTRVSSSSIKAVKPKGGKISFHKPGEVPQDITVKAGTTLGGFVEDRNIGDFDVFVNGQKVGNSTILQKGDNVRVGVKTKNG